LAPARDVLYNCPIFFFLFQEHIPIPPPEKTKEDVLLFFKLYNPEKEELRYVGRTFVKGGGKPMDILEKLNEMAGFAPNEEIQLFEEIKFEPNVMCEPVDKKFTFKASQLEDGDIICYQKGYTREEEESYRYPDVPSFLEYVRNRQVLSL
jgi:ubiquitin carboxyl-terminal hydrolase 7